MMPDRLAQRRRHGTLIHESGPTSGQVLYRLGTSNARMGVVDSVGAPPACQGNKAMNGALGSQHARAAIRRTLTPTLMR
jgi:hypothetical protein